MVFMGCTDNPLRRSAINPTFAEQGKPKAAKLFLPQYCAVDGSEEAGYAHQLLRFRLHTLCIYRFPGEALMFLENAPDQKPCHQYG